MATVEQIIERVQRRVIDLPSAVQAEIQDLVEKAHREIQDSHNFMVMKRRFSRTTTVGNPSLGTIATVYFKEYIPGQRPFFTDDSGDTRFLSVVFSEDEVRAAFNQDTTLGQGMPRVLLHRHQAGDDDPDGIEWKVYPVPDGLAYTSTGEYSIQIPYYRRLIFPSSTDWFTENADWYLTAKATAEAFALDWDLPQQTLWEQKAAIELRRVINRDKLYVTSALDVMVPYKGVNEPKVSL